MEIRRLSAQIPLTGPDSLEEIEAFIERYGLRRLRSLYEDYQSKQYEYLSTISQINSMLHRLKKSNYAAYDDETRSRAIRIIQKADQYHPVVLAIEMRCSVQVVKYLIEVSGYAIPDGTVLGLAYRINPANRDMMQLLIDADTKKLFKHQGYSTWLPAILSCDFNTLEWLASRGAPVLFWIVNYLDAPIDLQACREDQYVPVVRQRFQHFITYFRRYTKDFSDHTVLQLGYKLYHAMSDTALKESYLTALKEALEQGFYADDKQCLRIQEALEALNPEMAVTTYISLLDRYNRLDEARYYCLLKQQSHDMRVRDAARIALAKLLLRNRISLNECNDPVRFYEKNYAVKALYYLSRSECTNVHALTQQCFAEMSDEGVVEVSVNTCSMEAMTFYVSYVNYKNDNPVNLAEYKPAIQAGLSRYSVECSVKGDQARAEVDLISLSTMRVVQPVAAFVSSAEQTTPVEILDPDTLAKRCEHYGLSLLKSALKDFRASEEAWVSAASALSTQFRTLRSRIAAFDLDTIDYADNRLWCRDQYTTGLENAISRNVPDNVIKYMIQVLGHSVRGSKEECILSRFYRKDPSNFSMMKIIIEADDIAVVNKLNAFRWEEPIQARDFVMLDWLQGQGVSVIFHLVATLSEQFRHQLSASAVPGKNAGHRMKERSGLCDFMACFEYYMTAFLDYRSLGYALDQAEYLCGKLNDASLTEHYVTLLEKALKQIDANHRYHHLILQQLESLAPAAAMSARMDGMIRANQSDDAMHYCLRIIRECADSDPEYVRVYKQLTLDAAKFELAKRLLKGQFVLNEKGDPLVEVEQAYVIKAYYYLQSCQMSDAPLIRAQCHTLLSEAPDFPPSMDTWTKEALEGLRDYQLFQLSQQEARLKETSLKPDKNTLRMGLFAELNKKPKLIVCPPSPPRLCRVD